MKEETKNSFNVFKIDLVNELKRSPDFIDARMGDVWKKDYGVDELLFKYTVYIKNSSYMLSCNLFEMDDYHISRKSEKENFIKMAREELKLLSKNNF